MLFVDYKLSDFNEQLASASATPGGGGAAGDVGSNAAALIEMVLNLTYNDKNFAEIKDEIKMYIDKNLTIRKELLSTIDEDKEAFNKMVEVFKMPKNTDDEKKIRKEAMQRALTICSKPPLKTMRLCYEGLKLVNEIKNKISKSAWTDIVCGIECYKCAINMCYVNVHINTDYINDATYKNEVNVEVDEIISYVKNNFTDLDSIIEDIK